MSLYVGIDNRTAQPICATLSEEQIMRIIEQRYQPKFGTVKYVVRPSVEIINEDSTDFDGWVYADGSVRDISQYPLAQQYYKKTTGNFRIENLYTFIQHNGQSDSVIRSDSEIETLTDHNHHYDAKIKYNNDFVLTAAFNIIITDTDSNYLMMPTAPHRAVNVKYDTYNANTVNNYVEAGYVPTVHGTNVPDPSDAQQIRVPLNLIMNANFKVINTDPAGEEHPDCYPEHIKVFPFIYIGKKIQSGD